MAQKAKVKWLNLGDGNNSYFHATVRSKAQQRGIQKLSTTDGETVYDQASISGEFHAFYTKLVGSSAHTTSTVDITVLRKGSQLQRDQAQFLTQPVTEPEIWKALKSIGDNKSPGLDGYGALFFKYCWATIKHDVIKAA